MVEDREKVFVFNTEINKIVAENVSKYRKLKKMTQEELAYYCDLSNEFIRRVETSNGKRGFSLKSLYKISVVLDISIEKFFEE